MKHFVFKIIILIAPVALVLVILNHLYVNTNFWKGENYMNKFNDVPYKIELANFGSSHGVFDFKYDCFPEINSYNFGLLEQTYYYDYQLCKKYIDHFKKNAVVIILISYFGITQRPDYSKYRYRYYRVLPKSAMDYWSLEGAGLPPLEALSCEVPVLASDIGAVHEYCGDAVHYFNPEDYAVDLQNIIKSKVSDSKKVLEQLSWDKVAADLKNIIRSIE